MSVSSNEPVASPIPGITLRHEVRPSDREAVRRIVSSTGFFRADEIDVAVELVDERLAKGIPSGYHFIFADTADGQTVGYTCYGPIACTVSSFDLFWIAVDTDHQRLGLGRVLLQAAEVAAIELGATRMYIETSSREQYLPTRAFYERAGYVLEAELVDFYAPGDAKAIFGRHLRCSNG